MKRLLFITECFPPEVGSFAQSAERIAKTLGQFAIAVDVLTWSRGLEPGEVVFSQAGSLKPDGLSVYRIGLYRHWDRTMPHALSVLDDLHQAHPYQAVWGHYLFPAGFLATWFANPKSLPSVVSARGNDVDRALCLPEEFARLQWTLTNAGLITAVNREMAHKIQTLGHRDDVIVLNHAVDEPLLVSAGKEQTDSEFSQPLNSEVHARSHDAFIREKAQLQALMTKLVASF